MTKLAFRRGSVLFLYAAILLLMMGSASFAAVNDLVVVSPHGVALPPVGTNVINYTGSTGIDCLVAGSPILNGGEKYVCTGWLGTGNVPASGSDTNVSIAFSGDSSIAWQWKTQYLLKAESASLFGTVSPTNEYFDSGDTVYLTGAPEGGYMFSHWIGDVPSGQETQNPLSLTMDQARSITGVFDNVIYVSPFGNHQSPFTTWATAATNIQSAIDVATGGQTVLVTNSIYVISSPLMVGTGLVVQSVNGRDVTIIEEDGGGGRCVELGDASVFAGFTIRNGDVTNGIGTNTYPFAGDWGGGVFLDHGGELRDCLVTDCYAKYGGGIYCYDGGEIVNTIVSMNTATTAGGGGRGGGIFVNSNALVRSSLIVSNTADYGGGAYCEYGGLIESSTITTNIANLFGGGVFLDTGGTLLNTIVFYNRAYQYDNYRNANNGQHYYYCCTAPILVGAFNEEGNITNYPGFVDVTNGVWTLDFESPCVDTGFDADWMNAGTDVIGTNRILNGTVDIGAYEFIPPMVSAVAGPHGLLSPSGSYYPVSNTNGIETVSVIYSNDLNYVITPELYYLVDDVLVDGQSIGSTNFYAFTGLVSNHTISVTFVLGTPTLTSFSPYGTTIPPDGSYDYTPGESVTCLIIDTDGVTNDTSRYMFVGWLGAGSVPSEGLGSSVTFDIAEDSEITWNWKTQSLFSAVSSSTSCTVSPSNDWVDIGTTNYMVEATPSTGWVFVNWTGDVALTNATNNPLYLAIDQPTSVTGVFELIKHTLIVDSLHGTPSPSVGTHTNDWGTLINASIAGSPDVNGSTQYIFTGWTGTGSTPASGSGTSTSFNLITNSTINWRWKTQYRLITDSQGNGAVLPVTFGLGKWIDSGTVVEITPYPADAGTNRFRFSGWLGDVPPAQVLDDPLYLTMDKAHSVTGTFEYVPEVVYVSPSGNNTFPFNSWVTATTNISVAVDTAGFGTLVHVADGVYTLTRSANMNEDMTMISENGADSTIIDGGGLFGCVMLSHSNAVLDGFTVRNGFALDGAGVYISAGTVRNCIITGNAAYNRGGGVAMEFGGLISHCIISNNVSTNFGAGVALKRGGTLRNSLVVRNGSLTAPSSGGGVFCDRGGVVESCTIVTNIAMNSGGGVSFNEGGIVSNSIVYYNLTEGSSLEYNYAITISGAIDYSCSYPEPTGTGNTDVLPKFSDIAADDYVLLQGSPCIDTGVIQTWMVAGADLNGAARVQDGFVDMGAYEGSILIYGVTATKNTGGVISPMGTTYVLPGDDVVYTVTPTGTYFIAEITVDGVLIGATNSYTFSSVGWNHTIHATFAEGATTAPKGTPYWWMDNYGLASYATDELTDNDLDGHLAWEEYIADTDPTDGTSYLHITDVAVLGASHVVTWPSSAARNYSLMTLSDLISGTWTDVPGQIDLPGVAGTMVYTNLVPLNTQFYRVSVSLP